MNGLSFDGTRPKNPDISTLFHRERLEVTSLKAAKRWSSTIPKIEFDAAETHGASKKGVA